MSDAQLAYIEQRRSTRLDRVISLMVHGADLSRLPYEERVSTLTVSGHGCCYRTKYELIRGDLVFLRLDESERSSLAASKRARVKSLHPAAAGQERVFEVAVELETPGNVWGIASPPADWPAEYALESPGSRRALQVLERSERPAASLERYMAGLGAEVQKIASEAASDALMAEKNRFLLDFRAQLQEAASSVFASVLAALKEELALHAVQEVNAAYQNQARSIYQSWRSEMENDLRRAAAGIEAQGAKVSSQVESMALGAIDRLRHNMDASRRDAVERCLALLRQQLVPLLAEVQAALGTLAAAESNLKVKALAICNQFEEFLQEQGARHTAAVEEGLKNAESRWESLLNRPASQAPEISDSRAAELAGLPEGIGSREASRDPLAPIAPEAIPVPE